MPAVLLLVVAVAKSLTGCTEQRERLPGEGPIVAFERHDRWLSVFADPATRVLQLVHKDKLERFMPGDPAALTGIVVGPPDTIWEEQAGSRYFVYRRPQGVFKIGEEEYVAGGDIHVSYPLYYYPTERRPESFLHPLIVQRLRRNRKEETVMLFECGFAQPELIVVLENGLIEEVVWTDLAELRLRSDAHQCTPWD
ncbi:hypothetical protein AMJ82_05695 [candidate division TA06 bacterium SM23_40]|uniref:Uncharacterized protein n=1 Tax=candidate division TA06 bacterium SM23_40 TaxID=1703774 RepID=A0A0S8G8K8_UNCT6|nr:MAG: hypothetical protein AMJ82_05695 [candidate division TA06 bacterium SM23_40]